MNRDSPRVTKGFVSQYVDLRPMAHSAIGLFPFHDVGHPSPGVNGAGNQVLLIMAGHISSGADHEDVAHHHN
jgi:hypothetical protein